RRGTGWISGCGSPIPRRPGGCSRPTARGRPPTRSRCAAWPTSTPRYSTWCAWPTTRTADPGTLERVDPGNGRTGDPGNGRRGDPGTAERDRGYGFGVDGSADP